MLEELTVAGMSSDESDSELATSNPALRNSMPSYEITTPVWRNPKLHAWLRVFDNVYLVQRRVGGPSVGDWPHTRYSDSGTPKASSSDRFVVSLPTNAYNPAWLRTRHDRDFVIHPLDEEYSFTHDPRIYS